MKKIKQHYPRRSEMLKTPFGPLSDEAFRGYVAAGAAIPGREGTALIVAKWRDGPGMDADVFLKSLHAEGSTLEVRLYHSDVNIRVIPKSDLTADVDTGSRVRKRPGRPSN